MSDPVDLPDPTADANLADDQPTWSEEQKHVLGALGALRFGVDVPPDLRDLAYEQVRAALVRAVEQARLLDIIRAEIASYEDVLDDPHDCERFTRFVVELLGGRADG
jgi:hypothetical protein